MMLPNQLEMYTELSVIDNRDSRLVTCRCFHWQSSTREPKNYPELHSEESNGDWWVGNRFNPPNFLN